MVSHRVSKAEQRALGGHDGGYFAGSSLLCHVLHLVDIRHEPTAEDREMNAFLRASGLPFSVVATKADKISRGARMKHIAAICPRAAGAAVGGHPLFQRGTARAATRCWRCSTGFLRRRKRRNRSRR